MAEADDIVPVIWNYFAEGRVSVNGLRDLLLLNWPEYRERLEEELLEHLKQKE